MNFADLLRSHRSSASTVYQEFLIEDPKFSNHAFIFLEGHDDPSFYYYPISRYVGYKKVHLFKCGKKNEVYDVYNKIIGHTNVQNITLFFVDKDLSDILGETYPIDDRIHVTDYYSIENYLVTEEVFLGIVRETFHFPYRSDRIDAEFFLTLFNRELENFYNLVHPIMAWILFSRAEGFNPQLSDLNLSSIFSIDGNMELQALYDDVSTFNHFTNQCNIATLPRNESKIANWSQMLRGLEPKQYIRGKYELWFLIKFIDRLITTLKATEKIKVKVFINEGNAISFLAQRINTPLSLLQFIQKHLSTIVTDDQ